MGEFFDQPATEDTDTANRLKVICSRKELLEGLQKVAPAVSTRSSLPILSHVLIGSDSEDRIRLLGSDLEIGISCTIPADVKSPGKATASVRTLMDIINRLPDGEIELTSSVSNSVRIRTEHSDYKLLGFNSEEYPQLPEVVSPSIFRISQEMMHQMIRRVLFAVSPEETRAIFTGVLFEIKQPSAPSFPQGSGGNLRAGSNEAAADAQASEDPFEEDNPALPPTGSEAGKGAADLDGVSLRLVSTDSHRLALINAPLNVEESEMNLPAGEPPAPSFPQGRGGNMGVTGISGKFIVPARAMNELNRLIAGKEGDIRFQFGAGQVLFLLSDGTVMVSRLIEGQFPAYERLIPVAHSRRWMIERLPFLNALLRATVVAREGANRVVLQPKESQLSITAESNMIGAAHEEVEVEIEGDSMEVAFNVKYLTDALAVLESDGCWLNLTEPLKPAILQPIVRENSIESHYLCLMMPMEV
ncbi:MAG: DNA polymerase III subunit beta [Armatimonadetes bacterium]|nr:DNA polymerase III subunit beta [Armatimonadota bacterium]